MGGHIKLLESASQWKKDSGRVKSIVELIEAFFRRGNAWQVMYVQGGGKRAFKEVFENFALYTRLIEPLLRNGGTLVDLCSGGTALLGLMAFLWTKAKVIAIDKEKPSRRIRQYLGERFAYLQADMFSADIHNRIRKEIVKRPIVVVGVHCCGRLSFKVVEIGKRLGADTIVVVPCCVDREAAEEVLEKPFEGYADWLEAIRRVDSDGYNSEFVQINDMPTNANVVIVFNKVSKM